VDKREEEQFVQLLDEALAVRTHFEFLLWLQGKLQQFLPHEIMIAAWGDFSLGLVYFDIVSPLSGVRTEGISSDRLAPLLKRLFNYWREHGCTSFSLSMENGILNGHEFEESSQSPHLWSMKSAVVHAIKDRRGRHDCLYVLMSSGAQMPPSARKMLEALLPYIDSTLRQLDLLPDQMPTPEPVAEILDEASLGSLSPREIEIMKWVLGGKTNQEIGMILDISAFTVKNHLQRIFKKLDVLNRAQAVSKFKTIYHIE